MVEETLKWRDTYKPEEIRWVRQTLVGITVLCEYVNKMPAEIPCLSDLSLNSCLACTS